MSTRLPVVPLSALISLLASAVSTPAQPFFAPSPGREDAVVDSAREVLTQIMSIPGQSIPASLLARAEGVAIIPQMLKGGFIVGVRHGRGVVLTRDDARRWRLPMFVEITGASFGWQVGIQDTDLVLVFCTKRSLQNLMRGKFTIGASASAAAGPVGRDAEAATDARLAAEIYSYSCSRGLFAGVALDGAVLSVDNSGTDVYYRSAAALASQPGQPAPLPASAVRLQEQLARYSPSPAQPPAAGKPSSVDPQALRRQVADASQNLAAILDPAWRAFLALPAEIYSGDRLPAPDGLRRARERFATVASDPRYQSLAARPEFQTTWTLLRQYCDVTLPAANQTLSLPPPPR